MSAKKANYPEAEQNMQMGNNARRAYAVSKPVDQEATLEYILSILTETSLLPVNSVSANVMITGKLVTDPRIRIFLKIFDNPPPTEKLERDTLNLIAEYKIYSELYKLRHLGLTPNVLARVATYRLTPGTAGGAGGAGTFLEEPSLKAIPTYDQYFFKGTDTLAPRTSDLPTLPFWKNTYCIMSCSVEHSLTDCLTNMKPNFNDILAILYQIVHLLTWFEHIQMTHHDLHNGNIRVEYHANPIDLYYQHKNGGVCVRIRTQYVIKMYDFDHSTIYKQTVLGDGIVVQPVYNFDTGFRIFNAKEDCFKILTHILGTNVEYQTLYYKLIPGVNPDIGNNVSLNTLYQNLPPAEKNTYMTITTNQKCSEENHPTLLKAEKVKLLHQKELLLKGTFYDYTLHLNPEHIISFPQLQSWSLCSVYIPNSMMLPHLQMLKILSNPATAAAGWDKTISMVSAQDTPAQAVYPTPNVYYNDQW